MNGYADYMVEDEEFGERRERYQRKLIETLLERLENKYLTREKMYRKILATQREKFSLTGTINRIDVLDGVRENVKTSLLFGNYRRASWYLKMLERLCRKYL
ncbi:MAG: hypothetical protein IJU71_08310 [Selenomonadaceae bacterium]|nr:hypothetical protein [Selenomonadaceae bacterium]